jgi:DNA-binding PucR family transcriptional regulator
LRNDTVQGLLAGEPVDADAASRRLRYELDRVHVAFVLWGEHDSDEGDLGALERQAAKLATDLGASATLLVPLGGQLMGGWIVPTGELPAQARPEDGVLAALGRPGAGVDGFCRSHREALAARRVAQLSGRRPGSLLQYDDVALAALTSGDEQAARDFVTAELGPLAAQDDDMLRLAATLKVYLEERSSPRRTAQRLGVHENTIKNRVRAIEELRGAPPDHRIAETLVALRLTRLFPPA